MLKTLLILSLSALAACGSTTPPPQAKPSPVKKNASAAPQPARNPSGPSGKSAGGGAIAYALDDAPSPNKSPAAPSSVFKVESLPVNAAPVNTSIPPAAASGGSVEQAAAAAGTAAGVPEASGAAQPVAVAAASPAPSLAPPPLAFAPEEAAIPAGTSPAVISLIHQADKSRASGDLDGAVTSIDRALRIEPRNPVLTYKLSQIRIRQAKPQLAEELAGKAALLSGNNLDLKRKSWLLIAEARQMQGNFQGAKVAKGKADSFFGH